MKSRVLALTLCVLFAALSAFAQVGNGTITGTVTGASNPIPEFQYPLMAMLSLTLVAAVAGKLMLKTKRHKNADNAP